MPILCLAILWSGTVLGDAEPTSPVQPDAASQIDCLQKLINICGKSINPFDLVESLHSDPSGTPDIDSFIRVASNLGLHVMRFYDLSSAQLRRCDYPVLLHVASTAYSTQPDRFVLFLGVHSGLARLYVDSRAERSISFLALAKIWKGDAIGVSTRPLGTASASLSFGQQPVFVAVIAVAFVFAFRSWRRRRDRRATSTGPLFNRAGWWSMVYALNIAIVATCLGLLNDRVLGDGILLRQLTDTPPSSAAPFELLPALPAHNSAIVELNLNDAVERWRQGELFVDARAAADFGTGHVRGAVNVPAVSTQAILLEMSGVAKEQPFVVYCASSACARARYVATVLQENGYQHVAMYPDGWAAWPK